MDQDRQLYTKKSVELQIQKGPITCKDEEYRV